MKGYVISIPTLTVVSTISGIISKKQTAIRTPAVKLMIKWRLFLFLNDTIPPANVEKKDVTAKSIGIMFITNVYGKVALQLCQVN
jgi:hypothetical protein